MISNKAGEHPGIELAYTPRCYKHIPSTHKETPSVQRGYRFIINNEELGKALGVPIPKKTEDLVGDILAYETGAASPSQTKKLFKSLKKSGTDQKLQRHYSSRC